MSNNTGIDGLVGKTFNGYLVTRYIARGGMGVVYEASQISLDRPVAIKFLFPYLSGDATFRDRFEREARAIARLNHPNIVRVLDYGYQDSLHYMVMDLIDADSLRARLVRARDEGMSLQLKSSLNILRQVGSALTYAHGLGLVHRDVKPGNILMDKSGTAYLADFGVVKIIGDSQITSTGTLVGTPDYMAPEQSTGVSDIGPASDQYSLAVVAYEMLTARVPFQAPTPVAVMHKHVVEPPPAPRSIAPWLPPSAENALMRALSKNPLERFPTVDAFVAELSAPFDSSTTQSQTLVSPWPTAAGAAGAAAFPGTAQTSAGQYGSTPTSVTGQQYTNPPSDYQLANPHGAYVGGQAFYPGAAGQTQISQPAQPSYGAEQYTPAGAGGPPNLPPGIPVENADEGSRTPIWAGLAVVALLILAVGGFYLFVNQGDDGDPNAPGQQGSAAATATAESAATPTAAEAVIGDDPTATAPADATSTPPVEPESTATTAESSATEVPVVVDDATATAEVAAPTEEPATATSSIPDGYKEVILFAAHRGEVHDSQIYIMNSDGTDQQQITFARGHSWGPRLSPDGEYFFFSSVAPGEHDVHTATGGGTEGTGNHDVYVASVDGSDITKITFEPSWDNGWSWSPDGKSIAFTTDRDGNWEIYLMTPAGENFTRITDNPAADGWPSFTPDGRQIVFTSDRSGATEIYIMNVDGTNVRQLTDRPNTFDTYPFVSPDGTKIVFSSQVLRANEGEIYVMNIDGTELTRLTSTVALNYAPSWSPDGTRIVFASDRDGNHNIYTMNADGSNQTRLTTDPGEDTTPSWGYVRIADE